MADVLGAIAASDQLIRNFSSAYKQLAKAYRIIKYARKDIRQAKKRTKTIQEIFRFFKQTMEDVFQIDEFSVDLREYQQFYNGLNKHARKLVDKILNVIKSLRPILKRGTISMWTKLQTRWRWLVQDREALRLVYEEMGLLAGFMGFFMNLVRLQIAAKQYMLQKSAATKVQIDGLERTLNAQLEDIKHRMKSLGPTERSMISRENGDLLKEIRRIIRKEVKRIPRPGAAEDSTSGASSPSSLPPEPPSTPPTEPDNPDENQSNSEPTDKEINLTSSQPVSSTPSPAISPGLHPINLFPDSEASYVTIDQMSPQNKPNVANSSPAPTHLPVRTDNESESRSRPGKIYVPTALFGSPKKQHRPRAGRVSSDILTQTSYQGNSRSTMARDHNQRHSPAITGLGGPLHGPSSRTDEGASQDQDSSRLARRVNDNGTRGRTSRQQTYGKDGLVLPFHIIPTQKNIEAWLRTQ